MYNGVVQSVIKIFGYRHIFAGLDFVYFIYFIIDMCLFFGFSYNSTFVSVGLLRSFYEYFDTQRRYFILLF